jgi:hypothetical protein
MYEEVKNDISMLSVVIGFDYQDVIKDTGMQLVNVGF